jgi:myo-inositol 2-dehydrogenase / D-chiro-inositol 1-dehydrogenase
MASLRVGLVGCGRISQMVHLGNLLRLPGVEVAALAESDRCRREEAACQAPGVAAFADYRDLLEMRELDAVVICLPNGLHAQAGIAAIESGKHVYLEKPVATNVADGLRLVKAWRRSGLIGMIGFNYRFQPLYQCLKEQIQAKRFGELTGVSSVFSTATRPLPPWKLSRGSGGGVLLDLASHHIDLISYLLQQPVCEVFARIQSKRSEEDTATLQLRLAGGLVAQCFFSLSAVDEDRLEIYGTAAKLTADRYLSSDLEISDAFRNLARVKRFAHSVRSLMHRRFALERFRKDMCDPSFYSALACFVESVRLGRAAQPDFLDGLRSLAVIEAAEKSSRAAYAVSIAEFDHEDEKQDARSG